MKFIKRFSLFEILLVTVILAIHLYAALSDAYNLPNSWFIRDDAYYYFKVAQNITEGLGSTFDGINLTNGYHPLWMLICIPVFAFARFDLILPLRILLMIMAGFNAATAVLMYRLVKNHLSNAVAIAAASFWAFNSYIHFTVYQQGLETPLAAFAIILFIYKLSQFERIWHTSQVTTRHLVVLAMCAVLVVFSRLDLAFLACIGGIWIIFRARPIRFLLPLDILIIFVSMTCSVAIRTGIAEYNSLYANSAIKAVLLILIIKISSLYFFGAYQHPRTNSFLTTIRQIGFALTTSMVLASGLYLLFIKFGIEKGFPRSAFIIDWVISLFLILTLRLAAIWFGDQKIKVHTQPLTPLAEIQINLKKWLTEGAIYYGILGSTLAIYLVYNKITFGTSTPISGQVKYWWGSLIDTVYEGPAPNWPEFLGVSFHWAYNGMQPASTLFYWLAGKIYPLYPGPTTTDERYYISMFVLLLLAFIIIILNPRRTLNKFTNMALVPLAAGCGIQLLAYTTTAYGGAKEWYWISQMVFFTLVGSVLLDLVLHHLQKFNFLRLILEFASVALGIFLAYTFGNHVVFTMRYNYFPADRPYMEVLPYIEENTPPGSIIGMTGGGNIGYFLHDRTIVNMDGLINSYDYFQALKTGQAAAYLGQHGVSIIFASPRLLGFPPYNGQFSPYLEVYNKYGGKNFMYLLEEPKY